MTNEKDYVFESVVLMGDNYWKFNSMSGVKSELLKFLNSVDIYNDDTFYVSKDRTLDLIDAIYFSHPAHRALNLRYNSTSEWYKYLGHIVFCDGSILLKESVVVKDNYVSILFSNGEKIEFSKDYIYNRMLEPYDRYMLYKTTPYALIDDKGRLFWSRTNARDSVDFEMNKLNNY